MFKLSNFRFTRKIKFIVVSVLVILFQGLFAFLPPSLSVYAFVAQILSFVVSIFGVLWVQYFGVQVTSMARNKFFTSSFINVLTLPLALNLGVTFALIYFPNLSIWTKFLGLITASALMYATLLVTNIILVVYERGETIPLFRAASTWSQIIAVIVSIPMFAGIFKLDINGIFQSLLVGVVAFLFTSFFLWVLDLDPEIPPINRGELSINSLFAGYYVFALSLGVSFIPTEAFLRALLCASGLMSVQGYFQFHYKNLITKKLIIEYALITGVFLLLILIIRQ